VYCRSCLQSFLRAGSELSLCWPRRTVERAGMALCVIDNLVESRGKRTLSQIMCSYMRYLLLTTNKQTITYHRSGQTAKTKLALSIYHLLHRHHLCPQQQHTRKLQLRPAQRYRNSEGKRTLTGSSPHRDNRHRRTGRKIDCGRVGERSCRRFQIGCVREKRQTYRKGRVLEEGERRKDDPRRQDPSHYNPESSEGTVQGQEGNVATAAETAAAEAAVSAERWKTTPPTTAATSAATAAFRAEAAAIQPGSS
jgi:hypothetical protein